MTRGRGRYHTQRGSGRRKSDRGEARSGQSRGESRVKPTSSFTKLMPSRTSVDLLAGKKRERPLVGMHFWGLLGFALLILAQSGSGPFGAGLALILPGAALLWRPPRMSPGPVLDGAVFLLLLVLLAAFIPQFYWPDADWRQAASAAVGIDLPIMLSTQPGVSFEVWLQVAATFAWFYAVFSWPINDSGRRWFFFGLSIILGCFAGMVLWGSWHLLRFPAVEVTSVQGGFLSFAWTPSLLAAGGIATFAYAMKDVRGREVSGISGFIATGLCLLALFFAGFRAGLIAYFVGLLLWSLWRFRSRAPRSRALRVGLPILLFGVFILILVPGPRADWDDVPPGSTADTLSMVSDGPLTGFGLGQFSAVFPQYRVASATPESISRAPSSLLRFVAEGGLLSGLALSLFVFFYWRSFRRRLSGRGAGLRVAALLGALVYLLHGCVAASAHAEVSAYLALLLAGVALPPSRSGPARSLPPFYWRACGVVLLVFGLMWVVAAMAKLPLHSAVKQTILREQIATAESDNAMSEAVGLAGEWASSRPLDWGAHQKKGALLLANGDASGAAEAFARASFAEPTLGQVPYEQGFYWMGVSSEQAVDAWRDAFDREIADPFMAFARIVQAAGSRPDDLLRGLAELSMAHANFRAYYLEQLHGPLLETELSDELGRHPALNHFSQEQRTRVVANWIENGDTTRAEAFLHAHAEHLSRVWWLRSIAEKQRANFAGAVALIRSNLPSPMRPEPVVELAEDTLIRLQREFATDPSDPLKGQTLFHLSYRNGDYREALAVCQKVLQSNPDAIRFHYWRGQCLFQLGDMVESWFSFETYMEAKQKSPAPIGTAKNDES